MPLFSDYVARTNKRRRRRRRRSPFPWLLLVLALGIGAWFWWNTGRTPVKPVPRTALTNFAPAIRRVQPNPPTNQPAKPVFALPAKPPPASATGAPPTVVTSPPPQRMLPHADILVGASGFPRLPRDVLEVQVALARRGISSGSLDGVMGSQTRAALRAFQWRERLPETGAFDADTLAALTLTAPPLTTYTVTSNDLARLQPLSSTWLGKSQQSALDYETILELVAELGRASPNLIRRLNPTVDWADVVAGTEVQLPNALYPPVTAKAGFAAITLGAKQLQVFDAATNLLAHFPCSIAARVEKRPAGELHIIAIAENPNYTFNPKVFPESSEARALGRKLILPPGPNNPVGVAWVSLDKPGYGIHGTPSPEQVGRTESHGCFRLANWNATYFLKHAWVGMPVYVEP